MPSHAEQGSDFVSIVVADGTRIHTQLLADALRNDRGLQVVAAASNSEELLAAVTRVPIDVVVISHNLDDQPGHGTQVLREMRTLRPQIKGVILLDTSKPEDVLECFRAGARGIFSKQERIESLCKCIRSVHEGQVWARSVDLDHALDALANSPLVRSTNHKGIELLSARERQVIQHVAGGLSNRRNRDGSQAQFAHGQELSVPHLRQAGRVEPHRIALSDHEQFDGFTNGCSAREHRILRDHRIGRGRRPVGTVADGRTLLEDQRFRAYDGRTDPWVPTSLHHRLYVVPAGGENRRPHARTDSPRQENAWPDDVSATTCGSRKQSCRRLRNSKKHSGFADDKGVQASEHHKMRAGA